LGVYTIFDITFYILGYTERRLFIPLIEKHLELSIAMSIFIQSIKEYHNKKGEKK